jgi:hypothetical protein
MDKIFNKVNFVTCALLLSWIAIGEIVLHVLHLPTWPVFLSMVAFFIAEQKKEEIPKSVIGGAVGQIFFYVLVAYYIKPFMANPAAVFPAQLAYVLVFVGLIILLGHTLPKLFNSFTFLYFLVAALGTYVDPGKLTNSSLAGMPIIVPWLLLTLVGATIILYGCVYIAKWIGQICAPKK